MNHLRGSALKPAACTIHKAFDSPGGWLTKESALAATVEPALIICSYTEDHPGFAPAHSLVRRDNVPEWGLHERFGAHWSVSYGLQYAHRISLEMIRFSRHSYGQFRPYSLNF